MCPLPWNELNGVSFSQSVLASRHQEELIKEAEKFHLENEFLKAEQGKSPVGSSGLGWLRQLLHHHQKAMPAKAKTSRIHV